VPKPHFRRTIGLIRGPQRSLPKNNQVEGGGTSISAFCPRRRLELGREWGDNRLLPAPSVSVIKMSDSVNWLSDLDSWRGCWKRYRWSERLSRKLDGTSRRRQLRLSSRE
jgi:hypothetical protein